MQYTKQQLSDIMSWLILLTSHHDRYIKGYSIVLLKRLQEITDDLEQLDVI
jgi:hypothetical protein